MPDKMKFNFNGVVFNEAEEFPWEDDEFFGVFKTSYNALNKFTKVPLSEEIYVRTIDGTFLGFIMKNKIENEYLPIKREE